MKNIPFIVGLLGLLWLTGQPAIAQSDTQTISVLSQRYSFDVPEDWFATTEPQGSFSDLVNADGSFNIANFQTAIPFESLVIANNESTISDFLARSFELESLAENFAEFEGAALFSVGLPNAVAETIYANLGGDISTLAADLELPENDSIELQVKDIEQNGFSGTSIQTSDAQVTMNMTFLTDVLGNAIWILWASDADHMNDMNAIIDSFSLRVFELKTLSDLNALDLSFDVLPEVIAIDVPVGWWLMHSPDASMAFADADLEFIDSLGGNLEGTEGVVITALPFNHSDFQTDPYGDDGQLNPALIDELYSDVLGDNLDDTPEVIMWSNEDGLMGLAAVFDFSADDGAVYYFVLLDTDEQFTLLISFAAAETWADYEDVIRAIFDTARIVDEE